MFDLKLGKFIDESAKVAAAAHRAVVTSLRTTAYAIFQDVTHSITISPKQEPALPGAPPHSRRGQTIRSERYDVDADGEIAVIGPRASIVGEAMHLQEFGGEFAGHRPLLGRDGKPIIDKSTSRAIEIPVTQKYPARPSIGPALQREKGLLLAELDGRISA
jgi:hypothetical protein